MHLYADEPGFMDMLERFVIGGFLAGESVIVIGTDAHIFALNQRLGRRGFDIPSKRQADHYLDVNAETCLATFMKDGWPDSDCFNREIMTLIERASRDGRRVRAFGEMVAMLWEKKFSGATVRIEHLWNELRRAAPFPLFCSYPKAGFTRDTEDSLKEICAAHTKVISNRF